jgi:hypothetical protein
MSPSPADAPPLPTPQVNPDSPSNTDTAEFDAAVHNPFDEEQVDQDEGGTAMVIAEPSYNERGPVSAITSARKSKYKKKRGMQAYLRSIKMLRARGYMSRGGLSISDWCCFRSFSSH